MKTLSGLLVLLSVSGTAAEAAGNPCRGIQFFYYERIESQGFLGLLTPKADPTLVERAVNYNIREAWAARDALSAYPKTKEGKFMKEYLQFMDIEAKNFYLYELCELAQKKKIKRLTFACRADSEGPGVDEGGTAKRAMVTTECFVSTFKGKDPDYDDLLKYRWHYGSDWRETIFGKKDRYDHLADPVERSSSYASLIQDVVELIVSHERNASDIWSDDWRDFDHPAVESSACKQPTQLKLVDQEMVTSKHKGAPSVGHSRAKAVDPRLRKP